MYQSLAPNILYLLKAIKSDRVIGDAVRKQINENILKNALRPEVFREEKFDRKRLWIY